MAAARHPRARPLVCAYACKCGAKPVADSYVNIGFCFGSYYQGTDAPHCQPMVCEPNLLSLPLLPKFCPDSLWLNPKVAS